MDNKVICHLKPYIQPFEELLAIRELTVLAGNKPEVYKNLAGEPTYDYLVHSCLPAEALADRLTYWEWVSPETAVSPPQWTCQVRREATTNVVRNGITPAELAAILPFNGNVPVHNRRNLRYGPHGIHEYRGKFFPQLVRSLLNMAGVPSGATVLDPMSGSGTTAVEAVLSGYQAYGLDANPLSVMVSQVKCDVLKVHPEQLACLYESVKTDLQELTKISTSDLHWLETLHPNDQQYLTNWFAHDILIHLDAITCRIHQVHDPVCRNFFLVVFSNILRKLSWQKEDDLRVRRDVQTDLSVDVVAEFLTELNRSVRTVLAFLYENQGRALGDAQILAGDARQATQYLTGKEGQIDVIITSPPYATALPYLDTDRLSLYYLGLLSRREHRQRDYAMIGNREISNGRRLAYWAEYQQKRSLLTDGIASTIDQIEHLNRNGNAGFRRQNLPALLARYFLDMRQVLENFAQLLRPGAPAYVVVGNNHTIAGGQRVEIRTDHLLAELGETIGLHLKETISMEMLVSRDIFKKNASSAETILCFCNS